MSFEIDPRLVADTHLIGELPLSRLLLMDDARFAWLILVPRIAGARELIDLDCSDQQSLLGEVVRIGRAVESLLQPDKINIASLGNIVSQLHVHVVARHSNDAAWPAPVWGHGTREPYSDHERHRRIAILRETLGLHDPAHAPVAATDID